MAFLFERPAAIKRLIDYIIRTWPDHARIDAEKIGFFGFREAAIPCWSPSAVFLV
jgi:predicted dienelactone hydrolase